MQALLDVCAHLRLGRMEVSDVVCMRVAAGQNTLSASDTDVSKGSSDSESSVSTLLTKLKVSKCCMMMLENLCAR